MESYIFQIPTYRDIQEEGLRRLKDILGAQSVKIYEEYDDEVNKHDILLAVYFDKDDAARDSAVSDTAVQASHNSGHYMQKLTKTTSRVLVCV